MMGCEWKPTHSRDLGCESERLRRCTGARSTSSSVTARKGPSFFMSPSPSLHMWAMNKPDCFIAATLNGSLQLLMSERQVSARRAWRICLAACRSTMFFLLTSFSQLILPFDSVHVVGQWQLMFVFSSYTLSRTIIWPEFPLLIRKGFFFHLFLPCVFEHSCSTPPCLIPHRQLCWCCDHWPALFNQTPKNAHS